MVRDQIPVRTPKDREREAHEEQLMERISRENANPLQMGGEKLWDFCAGIYTNYLYSSGLMLLSFSMWTVYPTFVRYRHAHVKRYRRDQLVFRRWFCATVHMPKWNKKYLQRIVVPPPPQPQEQPDLFFSAAAANAKRAGEGRADSDRAEEPLKEDAVVTRGESAGAVPQTQVNASPEAENPFARRELSTRSSAKAVFHSAFEQTSASAIQKALMDINDTVYSGTGQFRRAVDAEVDLADVKTRIEWAVHKGNACVVLREDHMTRKTIPAGWEVWWVSAEEQQRRNMCKFWIMVLAFCRAMQDLVDMPEMPQMIQ